MDRKLVGAMLLILASCGCRACDCNCDYLPPVLDGPYAQHGMRSGSATSDGYEIPLPVSDEAITPLPIQE